MAVTLSSSSYRWTHLSCWAALVAGLFEAVLLCELSVWLMLIDPRGEVPPRLMEVLVADRSPILMLNVLVLLSSVNPYCPGDGWVDTELAL